MPLAPSKPEACEVEKTHRPGANDRLDLAIGLSFDETIHVFLPKNRLPGFSAFLDLLIYFSSA